MRREKTTLTASEESEIQAIFKRLENRLTMIAGAGGTVTPDDLTSSIDTSITITATAQKDSVFEKWTFTGEGSLENSTNSTTTFITHFHYPLLLL